MNPVFTMTSLSVNWDWNVQYTVIDEIQGFEQHRTTFGDSSKDGNMLGTASRNTIEKHLQLKHVNLYSSLERR